MTVKDAITALAAMPSHAQLEIWMPGSRIRLSGQPFMLNGIVHLEGNQFSLGEKP